MVQWQEHGEVWMALGELGDKNDKVEIPSKEVFLLIVKSVSPYCKWLKVSMFSFSFIYFFYDRQSGQ